MTDWTYIDDGPARRDDADAKSRDADLRRREPGDAKHVWELGSVVANRYVVQTYVGRGRYGEVYKALDRTLSDPQMQQEHFVALHRLHDHICEQTQLLQKLESSYQQPHAWSHPNVVKIRGFGNDRGSYFLVMELLDGATLRFILDETLPDLLSESETFAVLRGIGDALKYAHAKGAIHGDIRPEKVFITTDYAVKVLDLLPATSARSAPFFVEDAAPNGLTSPDRRDDVYGLACLAYELLSGRHPFNANSPLEAFNAQLTLAPITGLRAQQWNALARGLALRREDRTDSVATLLAELGVTGREQLRPVGGQSAAAPTPPPSEPAGQARAQDDDMPVIGDYSSSAAARARPAPEQPPRAAPPPMPPPEIRPPSPRVAPVERDVAWSPSYSRDFDVYPAPPSRRDRAPRGTSWRFVPLALVAAAIGIAVYWNFGRLQNGADELIGGVGPFADSQPGPTAAEPSPTAAEPTAAEPRDSGADAAGEIQGEATVAAPQIATVAPESAAPGSSTVTPPTAEAPNASSPAASGAEAPAAAAAAAGASGARASEPAAFEFATRVVTISEGQAIASAVIRRRGGTLGPASIVWWTSDGTASADDDYANLGARVEAFAAGEEARTIHVPIVVDSRAEDRESFYLNMRESDQAGGGQLPAQRIEIVINDDDF